MHCTFAQCGWTPPKNILVVRVLCATLYIWLYDLISPSDEAHIKRNHPRNVTKPDCLGIVVFREPYTHWKEYVFFSSLARTMSKYSLAENCVYSL